MVAAKMEDLQMSDRQSRSVTRSQDSADRQSRSVRRSQGLADRHSRSVTRSQTWADRIHSSSTPCDKDHYLPLATVEEAGYEPVVASQRGEGWPYAPEGWPSPGDKWIWKVGKRRNRKGFWQDRYLILPKSLQKGGRQVWFTSKKNVEEYIRKEYPDADLDSFFGSFEWKVPCARDPPPSEGRLTTSGIHGRDSKASGSAGDGPLAVERGCKAGNLKCGLETGKRKPLKTMDCQICCIEFGFCQECSCVLCGKSTDQTVGEYSFIRCEGELNEEFVCGHVAHLNCALLCHVAGVVRGIGLDIEYYCRRCDKKTDLLMHVVGLLQATESVKMRGDVESNLNLALSVLKGTRRIEARSLQIVIESALKKLHSGMNLDDIGELCGISTTVDAGGVGDTTEGVHYQPQSLNTSPLLLASSRGETMQQPDHITCATDPNTESESPFGSSFATRNQDPNPVQPATAMADIMSRKGNVFVHDRLQKRSRLLLEDTYGTSDLLGCPVHITDLKFENKIHQALHGLRQSQETEYRLAEEKLFAQKELLLTLFQQLDMANSEFTNDSSSSSLENFDDLLVGVSDRVEQLRKENAKFGQMLRISNGFGSTRKDILRDHFGVSVDD